MALKHKQVTCRCGHSFVIDRDRIWCEKCCEAVYYNEKDKNKYRLDSLYVVGIIVAVVTFLTYVFMELIASPLLSA
jgi:predicted nucleic acid-binding Zn ribbon protein